jgi:hypothetical protein
MHATRTSSQPRVEIEPAWPVDAVRAFDCVNVTGLNSVYGDNGQPILTTLEKHPPGSSCTH